MPATYEEIAGVGEIAGQLGIRKDSIVAFTDTMIRMGTSTNMSAEDAAMALSRLMNILGTNQKDVDRFGSVIVHLGNNVAATETEISNMALRLAGMGKMLNMSESDVIALSASMSSLGIRAEMGNITLYCPLMKKLIRKISKQYR